MRKHLLLFLTACCSLTTWACQSASQEKIFPLGTLSDSSLVCLYVKIRRIDMGIGSKLLHLDLHFQNEGERAKPMFLLYTSCAIYNRQQQLISAEILDSSYMLGAHYGDTLAALYRRNVPEILASNVSMQLLQPQFASFYNFKLEGSGLRTEFDSVSQSYTVLYKKKKYACPAFTEGYTINSVRTYKGKDGEILVLHLATGHELQMGILDKNRKAYKARFPFSDIWECSYEEPLLHHGKGRDVYIKCY